MQVSETRNEGLKRGYEISITADELAAKLDEKLAEAQPEVEMKGFRKGKVPMALLKRQFGQRVMGEAIQETIDNAMRDHFESSGDRPADQPKVEMVDGENWKEGMDIRVTMDYEKLPDIPEVNLGSVSVERLVVKAEETAVKEALDNLASSAQEFEARKKGSKAKSGDQVVFDFVGSVDGKVFEGGSAEDYPLVLGSNSFIPGFEDQLTGVKAGEEKTVEVSFPEDYGAENLAGKAASFACTIKEVKEPKAAELNDELAKRFGAEDLASLKTQVAERIESEYANAARTVVKRSLLDQLDGLYSFELPESLLSTEAQQVAHQLWHEENPEAEDHNHDKIEPTEEHNALAARRVRLGLILADIGQKAKIEVTDAEMTQAIIGQARQYPGQEREFFEFVQKSREMQQQIRGPLFEDKVIDHIITQVNVTDKEGSKEDLEKAVEALDSE